MKKGLKISLMALIATGGIILQSCQKEDRFFPGSNTSSSLPEQEVKASKLNTFYGPTVPLGNGVARAWVQENENGDPVSVGMNLTAKALEKLPDQTSAFVLLLPKTKGQYFYTHVLLDWNPQGHEPENLYGVPHFDVHFYFIPNSERLEIPFLAPPQYDLSPDPKYIPDHYLLTPGIVPQMGAHWVDLLSPEFSGALFTKTFIWGTYKGKVVFFEPMITKDYLLGKHNDDVALRQPEAFQKSGWYPTRYVISYSENPDEYTVALTGLTYHSGE